MSLKCIKIQLVYMFRAAIKTARIETTMIKNLSSLLFFIFFHTSKLLDVLLSEPVRILSGKNISKYKLK